MHDKIRRSVSWRLFVYRILRHAPEGKVFGWEMRDELRSHDDTIGPESLHPLLHGPQEEGYLRQSTKVAGGKWRKYFGKTAKGEMPMAVMQSRGWEFFARFSVTDSRSANQWLQMKVCK